MAPGAGGRWLLHTMVGSIARSSVEGVPEGVAVDVVHPGGVDRRPADLPGLQLSASRSAARLGDGGEQGAEAVGGEQDPGAVVDEAGGDRVVVDGRLHRRQGRSPSVTVCPGLTRWTRSMASGVDDRPMIPTPRNEVITRRLRVRLEQRAPSIRCGRSRCG